MKMNRQQLEHLNRRLNEKIADACANHPSTKQIVALTNAKLALTETKEAINVLGKATKTELQSLLSELLSKKATLFHSSMVKAILELPAAKYVHLEQVELDKKLKTLQTIRGADMEKLRKKKDTVYDQAVFADSPDAVLEAIEAFMKE